MEPHFNEINFGNTFKKIVLHKIYFLHSECIFTGYRDRKSGAWIRGFSEIEMLIWISVISTILGGFFKIHKNFETKHRKIAEEYMHERSTF